MISGKILTRQANVQTRKVSSFTALLYYYHHMLFLVLLVACCHWEHLLLHVTTLCITVMWFGFLCAAKDKKALLHLDQMLLQVSATNHDVASLSVNAPMKKEDCYSVM